MYGLSLVPPKQYDLIGLGVLLGYLLLIALFILYHSRVRRRVESKADEHLRGAVRFAATRGDLASLEILSQAPDFDVDSKLLGFTALQAACIQGQRDAALWLCRRGADIHSVKDDGWRDTALHYAAANGSLDTCKILLAYGAACYMKNSMGHSPADVAQLRCNLDVFEYLKAVQAGKQIPPAPRELNIEGNYVVPPTNSSLNVNANGDGVDQAPASRANTMPDLEAGLREQPPVQQLQTVQESSSPNTSSSPKDTSSSSDGALKIDADSEEAAWRKLTVPAFEGAGTEGTRVHPKRRGFRILAVLMQSALIVYLFWRALRTLTPGLYYIYSIPVFVAELTFYPFSFIFAASMWWWIDRPGRWAGDMLPRHALPHVDVYIVRCAETVDILEPSVIAALNMNWPGDRLTVHVLDDGKGRDILDMVKQLRAQMSSMSRDARLVYVKRRKVKGVPHHAKAGNINHCVLNSQGRGEYILVLDTDMIVHPDFLQRSIGHFYRSDTSLIEGWKPKQKVGFLQIPQDFYNIPSDDPLGHGARLFYGPMFQGRDGAGAAPCCGTGVIFSREALVSIGGQAYGSITEDYNTSLTFFGAGFASMFVNERLVFGQAPEDIVEVLKQRLRWAMGALQILYKSNPLHQPGLSRRQRFLLFEACSYQFMAIPMTMFLFVPIIYTFSQVSPITCWHLWEFVCTFGVHWVLSRSMWLYISWGVYGGELELWRSWQAFVWQAPNNIKAIWKVTLAEVSWLKRLFGKDIAFKITNKRSADSDAKHTYHIGKVVKLALPYVGYYVITLTCFIYMIIFGAIGEFDMTKIISNMCGLIWALVNCWCFWPLVATMLPRKQTVHGWKVQWGSFVPAPLARAASRVAHRAMSTMLSLRRGMSTALSHSSSYVASPRKSAASPTTSGHIPDSAFGKVALQRARSHTLNRCASRTLSPGLSVGLSGGSGDGSDGLERVKSGFLNVGRVAVPLMSTQSIQNSAFLTAVVLPERNLHTSATAKDPSMIAMSIDGDVAPVLNRAASLDVFSSAAAVMKRVASAPLDDYTPYALPAERVGSGSIRDRPAEDVVEDISYHYGVPDVMKRPAWLSTTILEDESLRGSRISYSGPYGQAAHQAASMHASDVLAGAAETMKHLAAVDEEDAPGPNSEAGSEPVSNEDPSNKSKTPEDGSKQESEDNYPERRPCGIDMHRTEGGALNDLMDLDLSGLSPLGELMQLTGNESLSLMLAVPQRPVAESAATEPRSYAATQEAFIDPGRSVSLSNLPTVDSIIQPTDSCERSTMEAAFLSPFATEALLPFTPSGTDGTTGGQTPFRSLSLESGEWIPTAFEPARRMRSAGHVNARATSTAQRRARRMSKALVDIAGSLSPNASGLLRGDSVLVVPVVPSSLYDHSIVSKPSFAGREMPARNFNFIIVSVGLILGLIGLSIWSALTS